MKLKSPKLWNGLRVDGVNDGFPFELIAPRAPNCVSIHFDKETDVAMDWIGLSARQHFLKNDQVS